MALILTSGPDIEPVSLEIEHANPVTVAIDSAADHVRKGWQVNTQHKPNWTSSPPARGEVDYTLRSTCSKTVC